MCKGSDLKSNQVNEGTNPFFLLFLSICRTSLFMVENHCSEYDLIAPLLYLSKVHNSETFTLSRPLHIKGRILVPR